MEEGTRTNVVTQDDTTDSTSRITHNMTPMALLTRQGNHATGFTTTTTTTAGNHIRAEESKGKDQHDDQQGEEDDQNFLRIRYQAAVKLLQPSPFTSEHSFVPNVSCSVWDQMQRHSGSTTTTCTPGRSTAAVLGEEQSPSNTSSTSSAITDGSTGLETLNALIRDPYTNAVWPLCTGTVVSLVGPSSSGKTQLALHWAACQQKQHASKVLYWTNDSVVSLQRRCQGHFQKSERTRKDHTGTSYMATTTSPPAIKFRSLASTTDLACALAEWEECQQQEQQRQQKESTSSSSTMIVVDALDGLESLGALDVFLRFQQWFLRLASWYPVRILVVLGSSTTAIAAGRFGTIQLELSKTESTLVQQHTDDSTSSTSASKAQAATSTVRVKLLHHETRLIDPSVPSISLTLSNQNDTPTIFQST
eukprot:Nitzschia sp. Nitz4//scaffold522_size6110//1694//2953//NITZ4_009186-RA/size6110-processed-gene-0.1-mRNA-1//-1//CDS//3329553940//5700//frame0